MAEVEDMEARKKDIDHYEIAEVEDMEHRKKKIDKK